MDNTLEVQELVEVVNSLTFKGSLTNLRKKVGETLGKGETTIRNKFKQLEINPIQNEEGVWFVPTETKEEVVEVEVTKQQIEEVVNQLKVVGTLTELRKRVGEHFGWTTTKTQNKMNRLEVEINQNEETGEWSSPTTEEQKTVKRNSDGFEMVEEMNRIVELVNSGKTLKQVGEILGRHQGQVGRMLRCSHLVTKYKNIQKWIELGVISSGKIFEIQRSTKNFEKENGLEKGLKLQYQIVENLVKSQKQDKESKGYVKNNHYEFLKSVETLPKEVVSSLFRIVGI